MQNKNSKKISRPKKSLGQNFLKSRLALRKIVEAGEIKKENTILEIGPGKGILTEELLKYAKLVIAIEKDNQLFLLLQEKFKQEIESGSLLLLNEDILNFNASAYGLKPSAYKIIANIPYNITGAILKKFLTEKNQPERMILMVQHEVAKRIMGRPGPASAKASAGKKESLLSISVKAYGEPKLVMKVPARYFSPAPKVDSAVIAITNISRRTFEEKGVSEEKFWEIVKAGFAHKRKKLSGNLKNVCKKESWAGLGDKRAEDLILADWITLASG